MRILGRGSSYKKTDVAGRASSQTPFEKGLTCKTA